MSQPRKYRAVITTPSTVFLPKTEIVSVADELNAAGQIDLNVPYSDPGVGAVAKGAEVQVWRSGDSAPIKTGVITRIRRGGSSLSVQAPGLWWYFSRRFVGKAGRTNWLGNGGFESGVLAPWTDVSASPVVVTSHRSAGTYGLQVTQALGGQDAYVWAQIAAIPGNYWTLDADIHIYSDVTWVGHAGPNNEDRGLYMLLIYPPGGPGDVKQIVNAAIDSSYVPGHSYHLQTGLTVPADAPSGSVLQVRLYAPGGRMMWDEVRLTLMESLSYPMTAQEDVVNGLILHAQDASFGKTDLGIGVAAYTRTTIRDAIFQMVDHAGIASAVEQYAGMPGGIDFDIDPATRKFTMWPWPRGQTWDAGYTLSLLGRVGDSCTGDGFAYDEDLSNAVSTPIVQGDGAGPGRSEASITDTSATGGLYLEDVLAAVPGTGLDGLYGVAHQEVAKSAAASATLTITTKPWPAHLGVVKVGDRVPVHVNYRGCVLQQAMRLVRMVEHPNGTLTMSLNP